MYNKNYTTFIAEINMTKLLEISVPNEFINPTNMEMNSYSDVMKFIAEHISQYPSSNFIPNIGATAWTKIVELDSNISSNILKTIDK